MAKWLTNPTRNHEVVGLIPSLAQWVKDLPLPLSCGVGRRRGLDLVLLCLWCRLAATTPIRPLAQEPPYAAGVALEKAKRQKTNKQTNKKTPKQLISVKMQIYQIISTQTRVIKIKK